MSSTLESYELIRFAEAFEARLATAGEMLAGRPGLEPEKGWLAAALELVRTTRAPSGDVLDRVKDLPELEEAREEFGYHQLGLWVDALEKLHAGITFTASSRAPVIEALFPHVKFAQLRRAPRDTILEYATSYERRTKSAYVTRIFARDDFALVRPVMEQVAAAHAAWRSSHEPAPLTPEQENVLREELVALGRKLDVALRQARLLSEAALVPVPSVHEAAGLSLKPKRRAGRGLGPSADEGMGGFNEEPVDSMEPTEAELAEVAALDAGGEPIRREAAAPASGELGTAPEEEDRSADELPMDDAGADAAGADDDSGSTVSEEGKSAADGDLAATAPAAAERATAPHGGTGARGSASNKSTASRHGGEPGEASASGATAHGPAQNGATASAGGGKAARSRASAPPPTEAPVPSDTDVSTDTTGQDSAPEPRGARKGRKKAEAAPASEAEAPVPASTEAQAPRVRKKKAAPAPDASGSDTP
ncbi:hypothetical protein [Pyxidicoccus xibeiensis]|uniref:hypothetical protein n=1 Tax=Pyxidicoccus xibeiensis TaxID=2906759 RepID=UPI0020A7399C|nr:hypothetical protein [Pyxidicoccus xibeiensis]MCP3142429.1 hypothetical protein [Pyxidicoccus xibeiensis]